MKRKFRLTRSADFQRVRRYGKSYAHPLLVLIVHESEGEETRFGVAAGRSVGNAVTRNRAKRLIRAALLPYLSNIELGWDVVIIARRPMAEANFQETKTALENLLRRAHLIREKNDEGHSS